jgi:RNA-directed DNA polymerase
MIKTSINLQDLRRRIYIKAKAEKSWRFWGLYVHVCKMDTLHQAYLMAKQNKGAPGIDGVTFEDIERDGVEAFLGQIREELVSCTYRPMRNRTKEIPKGNGKTRTLGIPSVRDRVVQGAVKLILEPIFEADFQDGSFGYRPKRTAHEAVTRVAQAIVESKTRVIDLDLKAYFDTVRHDLLLQKVAERVQDKQVLRLLKMILKASGKRGVPQGGVISPLLANLYLNEVDMMLEKAKEVTREGRYTHIEYARFADDLVVLVDCHRRWDWLFHAAHKRLLEELAKLHVQVNAEKTRLVELHRLGESFGFLGFEYRKAVTLRGKQGVRFVPKMKARTSVLGQIKEVFGRFQSQPVDRVIDLINPILRGWVSYFRIGHSSRCFGYVRDWVEKKVRRHLMRARNLRGFGWTRWSRDWLYTGLGLYGDYGIRYWSPPKARPAR